MLLLAFQHCFDSFLLFFASLCFASIHPNRIQREFYSNGGIAPFGTALASSYPRKKTNLFKRTWCPLLLAERYSETNQIQREFSCNVAIATQEFSSASKHPRKKTNLFKLLAYHSQLMTILMLPNFSDGCYTYSQVKTA
jgi:hypothetical protein